MHNVVIFGASGHGRVVLDILEKERRYHMVGFVDSFKNPGDRLSGFEVLGTEFQLPKLIDKYNIKGGIVAIGDNWIRMAVVNRILQVVPDFEFISAVHPRAIIGRDVKIGAGSVIMPGTIVNAASRIGEHCILNTNCSLDHDSYMKPYSSLAPNVCTGGRLMLGKHSAVCLGANIIENVTIGDHAVIGAGSLVTTNIPSNVIAYGSPAQVVREREAGEPYLGGNRNPVPGKLYQG